MRSIPKTLWVCFAFLFVTSAAAFTTTTTTTAVPRIRSIHHLDTTNKVLDIRGGARVSGSTHQETTSTTALQSSPTMMILPSAVESALLSGPWGVVALAGVASSVVVPLTMIRQGYSFSVGYGLSVFAMGLALSQTFGIPLMALLSSNATTLSWLAAAVLFYGLRLGSFLLMREFTVSSKREQIKSFDKSPRLQRLPIAVAVSLFYAFLTSPFMYAARAAGNAGTGSSVMKVGVGIAWLGALMEAIADAQKWLAKRNVKQEDGNIFVGPTEGFYRLCRHPNYFGELVYWFGLAIAGAPSFGKDFIPWICSLLGLYGIFGIMTGASKRLDGKQAERYNGQEKYDAYRKQVPATIFPWVRS